MSVVNTMLRELAARQPATDGASAVPLALVTPLSTSISATPTTRRWPWWFLLMLILAALIAGWRWSQASRTSAAAHAVPITPAPIATASIATAQINAAPVNTASPDTATAAPASIPAAAIAAASAPVATTPVQTSSSKPAAIGWELVQAEDSALTEFDEAEPVTDRATDVSTPTSNDSRATMPISHFDRQPASLSLEEQLQQRREQARQALASNDLIAARDAITQGLQLRSDDEQLLALQLEALAQTDPAGARAQAEQLLQVQPQQWRVRQWLGTEQLQQQQAAAAKTTLQIAAPLLTIAPDYHAVLALAEQQAGEHQAAANRYRQLLLAQPQHGRHAAGLALSLDAIGERSAAIAAWRRALTDPALPAAVARFGQQRLQQLNSPATQASP